jgi:hypothetical protein
MKNQEDFQVEKIFGVKKGCSGCHWAVKTSHLGANQNQPI